VAYGAGSTGAVGDLLGNNEKGRVMNTAIDDTLETARMTNYYRREYGALIGRKIVDMRAMHKEEMDLFLWYGGPGVVMILDDGSLFIPMRDEEGNGPGQLMIQEAGK
jgi:hypothetical protein